MVLNSTGGRSGYIRMASMFLAVCLQFCCVRSGGSYSLAAFSPAGDVQGILNGGSRHDHGRLGRWGQRFFTPTVSPWRTHDTYEGRNGPGNKYRLFGYRGIDVG